MALLTVVIVLLTLFSVTAARDAARAAKEQVELQTLPVLEPGENGLRGFTYTDGRRITNDHRGQFDAFTDGRFTYIAVAVQNGGPGFGVIRNWRVAPVRLVSGREHRPPTEEMLRESWMVSPSEEVRLGIVLQINDLPTRELQAAISRREEILVEIYYVDLSGGRRFKTAIVFAPFDPSFGHWQARFTQVLAGWEDPSLTPPSG